MAILIPIIITTILCFIPTGHRAVVLRARADDRSSAKVSAFSPWVRPRFPWQLRPWFPRWVQQGFHGGFHGGFGAGNGGGRGGGHR
jgi:hypothetical protein